jgi:hypothetical protein
MDHKPALGRLTPYSPNLLEDAFSEVCTELWLVASCPSLERVVTRRGKPVRKERGENAGRLPGASNLLNEHSLTAIPLILAFISFGIGATLPVVGEKGNIRIFTLPVREQLLAVADNPVVWRWAHIFLGAAAILLLVGLTMLTTILEGAGERVLSRLGLVGVLLAIVLWVVFSAHRAVITVRAAQETIGTGTVPPYYEPLAQWGFALFYVYAVVGFLALAAYGGSLLQVGLLPAWAGWGTIIYSIAMLVLLLITGDTLPAFHYFPPLLMGILLLMRG